MNFIGFIFRWIGEMLCGTRLQRLVINPAYGKLLIITGGLKWYDIPHLHHPLIHLRMDLEYRRDRPRLQKAKQSLDEDYDFTLHSDGGLTMMMNPEAIARLTNNEDKE